jgi:hypothetical protein
MLNTIKENHIDYPLIRPIIIGFITFLLYWNNNSYLVAVFIAILVTDLLECVIKYSEEHQYNIWPLLTLFSVIVLNDAAYMPYLVVPIFIITVIIYGVLKYIWNVNKQNRTIEEQTMAATVEIKEILKCTRFHESFKNKIVTLKNGLIYSIEDVQTNNNTDNYIISNEQCYSSIWLQEQADIFTNKYKETPELGQQLIEEQNDSASVLVSLFDNTHFNDKIMAVAFGVICVIDSAKQVGIFLERIYPQFAVFASSFQINRNKKAYRDILMIDTGNELIPPNGLYEYEQPKKLVWFSFYKNRTWICLETKRKVFGNEVKLWVWFVADTGAPKTFFHSSTIKKLYGSTSNYRSNTSSSLVVDKTSIHHSALQVFESTMDFADDSPAKHINLLGADIIWDSKLIVDKCNEYAELIRHTNKNAHEDEKRR